MTLWNAETGGRDSSAPARIIDFLDARCHYTWLRRAKMALLSMKWARFLAAPPRLRQRLGRRGRFKRRAARRQPKRESERQPYWPGENAARSEALPSQRNICHFSLTIIERFSRDAAPMI